MNVGKEVCAKQRATWQQSQPADFTGFNLEHGSTDPQIWTFVTTITDSTADVGESYYEIALLTKCENRQPGEYRQQSFAIRLKF